MGMLSSREKDVEERTAVLGQEMTIGLWLGADDALWLESTSTVQAPSP